MKKIFKKTGVLLTVLAMIFASSTAASFAYEKNLADRESSLTVYFGEDGWGFEGADFDIYRVADVSDGGEYTLAGNFRDYPLEFSGLDSSGWRALARTLSAYAEADELTPLASGKTGADGKVTFTGLSPGLYLTKGEKYVYGGRVYRFEPVLTVLPYVNDDGTTEENPVISAKFESSEETDEPVNLKVQKVWKDAGSEKARPESVSIRLLKDGESVDSVTLNGENNWEHTWEGLDSSAAWNVVEENVPAGYTVSVSREEYIFIVTNTASGGTDGSAGGGGKLPQTGMLWFPVPLLAGTGALFILAGAVLRRREK